MKIKIFDIKWSTKTAGPSPYNNERTELFFFGCKKALEGNPCIGCFNPDLWDCSKAIYDYTPEEIAFKIKEYAPNKYITIGGGEPTDQIDGLIELTRLLKAMDFNIMVYTYKDISNIIDPTEKSKINMLFLRKN